MKKIYILIAVVLVVFIGFFAYAKFSKKAEAPVVNNPSDVTPKEELPIQKGRIVWGGEVRTFQPCSAGSEDQGAVESIWIDGQSPALAEIKSTYEAEMAGTGPYSPMYAEITGSEETRTQDGFGADYNKAISIDKLVVGNSFGNCKQDWIVLENIRAGSFVDPKEPLIVTGKAKGNWYFEANLPIQILDRHDGVLANGYATAQGEWMTTEFVPFAGSIKFTKIPESGSTGKIVLKKDNPSDLRELDDSIEVMVYFK